MITLLPWYAMNPYCEITSKPSDHSIIQGLKHLSQWIFRQIIRLKGHKEYTIMPFTPFLLSKFAKIIT